MDFYEPSSLSNNGRASQCDFKRSLCEEAGGCVGGGGFYGTAAI